MMPISHPFYLVVMIMPQFFAGYGGRRLLLECVITPAAGKTSTSANKILKSLKISKTSDG
jgi:hypothetical protein